MKCTVCAINSKYIHSSIAPWCLKSAAEKMCKKTHTVTVAEGTINEPVSKITDRLIKSNADIYAFSCYIWNISTVKAVVESVKVQCPHAKIVLGGPEVSYRAESLLREWTDADIVISGEGELPFSRLLDRLPDIPSGIEGVTYRKDANIITNPIGKTLVSPEVDYTDGYCAGLNNRIAYAETSRGCPFACAFCLSGRNESVRFLPMDKAKELLVKLANSGAKTVKLIDRTFNCNPKRAYELFSFLIDSVGSKFPNDVCFHFEVGADLFDDATIELLNQAPSGLFQLEAGIQSFYEPALEACNRKTDLEKVERNLGKLIEKGNMHIHTDLIAGLPYEDFAEFSRSFNRAYKMQPNMLQLGFLKLLHGSALRKQSTEYGYEYSVNAPYEIISGRWITSKELDRLREIEDALERLYNSGRFRLTLEYVLKTTQMAPFDLFAYISDRYSKEDNNHIPLEVYFERVHECFSALQGVNAEELRNVMVRDRLSTNSTGKLPPCLRIKDTRLKSAAIEAKKILGMPMSSSGAAILKGEEDVLVIADYSQFDRVNGRYKLYEFPLKGILQ